MMDKQNELKNLEHVVSGGSRNQTTFLHKIFVILEHTSKFTDDINIVGAFWINSSGDFAVNPFILGDFMKLKANSLNKNFNMYNIVKMGNCKDFMSPVPLEQMKRWLIRKAAGYEFNKSTSLLEVDQIKPKYTQIDSTKEINIKQFIRSEYKEKVEYERYQTKIKTFWEATFKNGSPSPQQLARLLATATTCKFPQHNLEKNIKILLELFSNSGLIQFPTFCLFCSYFSYTNLQNRISDISNHMQSHNFVYEEDCSLFHNNFSSFTSMAIPNIDNSFAPFFTPIICDTQFLALFEIQPLETWTVCLGRTPGDFVILRKTIDRIWKCVINFDPIKNCFKVPNSTKIFEQYNSLQEVIKVLGLDENCCFKHNNHPVVNEITFDLFLESMINDKEMSSPQIECEFPSFLDELI